MEERILNALAGSPGKSAKEVARELGEATPIIMEHLLGLAASGALKQRTVGREQVFSIPRTASLPTPREIITGSWVQRVPAEPAAMAAPSSPTLYDRIGGTIELEIGDSPIKARFQSVEQLYRFLTELIENERAGHVPAGRKV